MSDEPIVLHEWEREGGMRAMRVIEGSAKGLALQTTNGEIDWTTTNSHGWGPVLLSEITRLAERVREQGWISVEDRLPEVPDRHISVEVVMFDGYEVECGFYGNGERFWTHDGHGDFDQHPSVTHWMPLPAPLTEEHGGER